MKLFTKLALVSAIAVSGSAMAMESMDDSALSSATGQEGITIKVETPSGIKINQLFLHDNDGLAVGTAGNPTGTPPTSASPTFGLGGTGTAGAIAIGKLAAGTSGATANQLANGITITQTSSAPLLTLDIDADGSSATTPFLNVAATVGAAKIEIGEISVVKSNTASTTTLRRGGSNKATIIEGLTLDMGQLTANVQLGNTPQGAMIKLNSTITGGLNISKLSLKDNGANGGGSIVLDSIKVADANSANLTLKADVNVKTAGLVITDNAGARDLLVKGIHLGAAANASIGDLEINGLDMGVSTITITGH